MSKSCQVEFFGNPQKLCFSGQSINARVSLSLDKQVTCKRLKLKVYGFAYVRWQKSQHHSESDKVDLMKTKINLKEPKCVEDEVTLEAGTHHFDFQFDIPSNCPSSFEGKHGRIRYMIKVIYVRTLVNTTKNHPFTVVNPLNLNNYDVNLSLPLSQGNSKSLWLGLTNDEVSVETCINKCGFVSGENIPVELKINNLTSSNIEEITLKLVLKALHKTRRWKSTHKDYATLTKTKIAKDMLKGKNCNVIEHLTIPPTLPSSYNLCEILDISYRVEVHVKLSGIHNGMKTKLPVVIGIIPLGVTLNSASGGCFDLNDYDMDPPTYEEAIFMTEEQMPNEKEEMVEDAEFVPVFPRYDFRKIQRLF
ncbi:hypothetical protein ACFFRR_000325 [Megaselia abdita]